MHLAAHATVNPSLCDMNHLLQSLGGNWPVALKLARMFLEMVPEQLQRMDAALQAADWIALRRVVHELRGSCAMFAASRCLDLAGALEAVLPDRTGPTLHDDCMQFRDAIMSLAAELRRFLAEAEGVE